MIGNEISGCNAKTRRVSNAYRPDIFSLFNLARKRLEPKFPIDLVIAGTDEFFARAVYRKGNVPDTVQIADFLPDLLDEDEMLYVIGHEVGHLFFFNPTPPANKDNDHVKILPDRGGCPLPIWRIVCDAYVELRADCFGIMACGEVDFAISAFSKMLGKPEINDRDHIVNYFSFEEIRVQMKALKLLKRSSLQYEILDQPLFQAGRNLFSEETFNRKMRELFVPWMAITAEEFNALEECACAAIYVLLASGEGKLVSVPEKADKHMKRYTCRPELLSSFTSIEQAYARIEKLSPAMRNLNHFLKYRHFEFISSLAFELEPDQDVAEEFLRVIGNSLGLTMLEVRKYLDESSRPSELEKAS